MKEYAFRTVEDQEIIETIIARSFTGVAVLICVIAGFAAFKYYTIYQYVSHDTNTYLGFWLVSSVVIGALLFAFFQLLVEKNDQKKEVIEGIVIPAAFNNDVLSKLSQKLFLRGIDTIVVKTADGEKYTLMANMLAPPASKKIFAGLRNGDSVRMHRMRYNKALFKVELLSKSQQGV